MGNRDYRWALQLTSCSLLHDGPNHLGLCSRLPIVDPPDFFTDYNDTLLITYLCSITQCANSTNELLDKFSVEHDRRGTGGGGELSWLTAAVPVENP